MRISRIGGVIAAASRKAAQPMLQVGSIPIIKRIVITFQQAGVFPIVVITGVDEEEVKYQLAGYGVIFIPNGQPEQPELFNSVKIGLEYMQGKCDRVAFAPVNVPMFTPTTLEKLISAEGGVVTPSHHGCGGHPVLLSADTIPKIMAYAGGDGLRGAIQAIGIERTWIPVEDAGVLTSVHDVMQLQEQLSQHNHEILHPMLHMSIERETAFFNDRLKLLLYLISDTHNVRRACDAMALSYGKAWNMINRLEQEVGYSVVERKHGGRQGGNTDLTDRGAAFLLAYQQYEEDVFRFTQTRFQQTLIMPKIL